MHVRTIGLFLILSLAACGEETATPTAQTDTSARPATDAAGTATTPATPSPSAGTAAGTAQPSTAAGGATGTESTAAGGTQTQTQIAAAPGAAGPGAGSGAAPSAVVPISQYLGQPFMAGPVTLTLTPDNRFQMRSTEENRSVQGRYAYDNGILTLSDPQGDAGTAKFPMNCRLEQAESGFRLIDDGGNCAYFSGLTFRRS
jgi:hypothetical protein